MSIENHCTVPQQKKMAEYLREVLQDKLDLSTVNLHECKKLPSPEILKGKVLVKVKLFLATCAATCCSILSLKDTQIKDYFPGEKTASKP